MIDDDSLFILLIYFLDQHPRNTRASSELDYEDTFRNTTNAFHHPSTIPCGSVHSILLFCFLLLRNSCGKNVFKELQSNSPNFYSTTDRILWPLGLSVVSHYGQQANHFLIAYSTTSMMHSFITARKSTIAPEEEHSRR